MFLEGKEYQTICKTAHLWAGLSPDETDPHSLPEKVKDSVQQIILGFQRGDLVLRTKGKFAISMDEKAVSDHLIRAMRVIPTALVIT